ncbi:MAG TPA: hypothetical protein VD885_00810 [Methylophilaceae bacterium]|nr:hypothetical protein [Methylophilaceae bacterium]
MSRLVITLLLSLLAVTSYAAPAYTESMPAPDRTAQAGEWSTILSIYDPNHNHYLLRTAISSDLKGCVDALNQVGQKITTSGDTAIIWTNHAKNTLNFEQTKEAYQRAIVLDARCVPGPDPVDE